MKPPLARRVRERMSPATRTGHPPGLSVPATATLLIIALYILLGSRLLPIGAGDLRIAGLFSTDEQLAGELLRAMIRHGNLGLSHFFSYGPADLYLARALLWLYNLLRPVDDRAILMALRLVSLGAGAGSIAVTYALGRRLWAPWTGTVAAGLIAMSATVLSWSTTAHPDMLQVFLVTVVLLLAVSLAGHTSWPLIAAASVSAGVAFATKYGGGLLLPPIWLAASLGRDKTPLEAATLTLINRLKVLAGNIGLSLGVFALAFLAVDPSVAAEPREFVSQVRLESSLAHHGHVFFVGPSPITWLRQLAGADLLGPASLILCLTAVACWTIADLKVAAGRSRTRRQAEEAQAVRRLPLELWTLGYLAFLMLWIGDVQPRYALPVLPGLVLFAAAGALWIAARLPAQALVLAAFLAMMSAPPLLRLARYEREQIVRMDNPAIAARIIAGRWLTEHVDAASPILHDAYSYVPPIFANAQETFGLTRAQIDSFRPRIIMTDAAIRGRFRDPAAAARYQEGPAAYADIAATYGQLEAGSLPCYTHLEHAGPVDIYGEQAPRGDADGC